MSHDTEAVWYWKTRAQEIERITMELMERVDISTAGDLVKDFYGVVQQPHYGTPEYVQTFGHPMMSVSDAA